MASDNWVDRAERLRVTPLAEHHLCSTCGWLGYLPGTGPSFTSEKVIGTAAAIGGTAAAVGGGGIALMGCGGTTIGIILVIVGIPLLPFAGVGVIPMVIGGILIALGRTATSAGTAVASAGTQAAISGGSSALGAHYAEKVALEAIPACPLCSKDSLIPASSPMALHQIQSIPLLAEQADYVIQSVLQALPETRKPCPACGASMLIEAMVCSKCNNKIVINSCRACIYFKESWHSYEIGKCKAMLAATNADFLCDKIARLPRSVIES